MSKNKRVLVQSAESFVVLFGLFIVINCFSTYRSFYNVYIPKLKEDSGRIKDYSRKFLEAYPSLTWLMDYWQENYSNLDVSRSSLHDTAKYASLPRELIANRKSITSEQAQALSPEHQRLFAEFCYREILSRLDELKDNMQMHSLYIVRPLKDKDAFVFYFRDSDEKIERVLFLGSTLPFTMSKHPMIQEMYSTGKEPREFEFVRVKDYYEDGSGRAEDILYDYEPLLADGKILGHISAAFFETDVKRAIFYEVVAIESVNVVCFVLLGVLLLFIMYRQVLEPLSRVQHNIRDYAENKDSASVIRELQKIKSRNEIGRLADDMSSLAAELDHYTEEIAKLSAEKAKLDSELSLAASIQQDALPNDFSGIKDFQLFTFLKPAKEVGGDLYDFFMLDDDHIVLAVGDVSGKGISAALLMMRVKTLLKDAALLTHASPLEIINNVNAMLCEDNDAMMFITLWFGIMTISTGEIVYVNAGHEYPLIKDSSGIFTVERSGHSRPLAINPNAKFSEGRLTLKHGDTVFVYTDGVPEATNENNEQFGLERLAEYLNEKPEDSPKELTNSLLERLNNFVGEAPQFDDITILCVKYS